MIAPCVLLNTVVWSVLLSVLQSLAPNVCETIGTKVHICSIVAVTGACSSNTPAEQ
jgi:hypothetical protein